SPNVHANTSNQLPATQLNKNVKAFRPQHQNFHDTEVIDRQRSVQQKLPNQRGPKLAGLELPGLPILPSPMARPGLLALSLQHRELDRWRMVLLGWRILVSGLGLR